jgi:hypothetical protein
MISNWETSSLQPYIGYVVPLVDPEVQRTMSLRTVNEVLRTDIVFSSRATPRGNALPIISVYIID